MLLCDTNLTAPLGCMSSRSPMIHLFGMPSSLFIRVSPTESVFRKLKSIRGQGYYTDSILRFRLTFPDNYPGRPPTVHFITDVFHPLISHQDGTFNLAPRFNPWRSVTRPRLSFLHYLIFVLPVQTNIMYTTSCTTSKVLSRSTRSTRLKRVTA
jgi:ubiquitin-protein ligase